MSTRVAVWLTDLESEVIYHLPGVFLLLLSVCASSSSVFVGDRCRRDLSSLSDGSFGVGSTTFDRLLFDVLRVGWLFRFVR